MASRVDCFRPKVFRCAVVIPCQPCQGDECLVPPLNDSVLLRHVCGGELMLDAFFITPCINIVVVELGAVVTSNFDDVEAELPLCSSCKGLERVPPPQFSHLETKSKYTT